MTNNNHYELLYIISPVEESEKDKIDLKVNSLLENLGGKINKKESWGVKKLSYPIKHKDAGYYFLTEFDLDGEKVSEIERELKITPEILRFRIFKAIEMSEKEKEKLSSKYAVIKREGRGGAKPFTRVKPATKFAAAQEEKMTREDRYSTVSVEAPKALEESKIKIEELDQKLEEILGDEDIKI